MAAPRETLDETIEFSSLSVLIGLIPHYVLFYALGTPLWTERIAEAIMAHTPSRYAVAILDLLGAWAKPLAITGALATLGFAVFVARWAGQHAPPRLRTWTTVVLGILLLIILMRAFHYWSWVGAAAFAIPALLALHVLRSATAGHPAAVAAPRRQFIAATSKYGLPILMSSGVAGVALESYLRNEAFTRRATEPVPLFPFQPRLDRESFGYGLVRKSITPVAEFYGMSKNIVDPVIDTRNWRLTISIDGKPIRQFRYSELLSLPRQQRYQTLRCISNTLKSDLMGAAEWSGVHLSQLVERRRLPPEVIEAAFIGVEGHDDSVKIDYAFGDDALLALGMNGKTLSRTHGFPVRLLAPRYYGCRNVKWIGEIRFVTKPYYGTWQRLGYTREPVVHIASHIDRMVRVGSRVRFGGVSFAGDRRIQAVRVRANKNSWMPATLETPLSQYTWTRWWAELEAKQGDTLEAHAQDQIGAWQELSPGSPFPTGLTGPTIVTVRV